MSESVLHSSPEKNDTKEVNVTSPGVSDELSNLYQDVSIDNILSNLNRAYTQLDSYQKEDNYDDDERYSDLLFLFYHIGKDIDYLINFHKPDPDDISKFNTFNKIWSGFNHDCSPGDSSSDLTDYTRRCLLQIDSDKLEFLERVSTISRSFSLDEQRLTTLMKEFNMGDSISDCYTKTKRNRRKFDCDNLMDYIKGYIMTISNHKDVLINELPSRLIPNTKKFDSKANMYF